MVLRLGGHAEAARNFADFNAAAVIGVILNQFVEQFAEGQADLAVALAGCLFSGLFSGQAGSLRTFCLVGGFRRDRFRGWLSRRLFRGGLLDRGRLRVGDGCFGCGWRAG